MKNTHLIDTGDLPKLSLFYGYLLELLALTSFLLLFSNTFIFKVFIFIHLFCFWLVSKYPHFKCSKKIEGFGLATTMLSSYFLYIINKDYLFCSGLNLSLIIIFYQFPRSKKPIISVLWSFLSIIIVARFSNDLKFFILILFYFSLCLFILKKTAVESLFSKSKRVFIPNKKKYLKIIHSSSPPYFLSFSLFIVITVFLFLSIPRLPIDKTALFSLEKNIGFSEFTNLNVAGVLKTNNEWALQLEGSAFPPIKGKVFYNFNGREWKHSRSIYNQIPIKSYLKQIRKNIDSNQPPLKIKITQLKPFGYTVFNPGNVIDTKTKIPLVIDSQGNISSSRPNPSHTKFEFSYLPKKTLLSKDDRLLKDYHFSENHRPFLNVGPESSILETYAKKIAASSPGILNKVEKTIQFVQGRCNYSLKIPTPERNMLPLESFIDVTKQGHCELFASAAAILLRYQGIPTRYVTGFIPKSSMDISQKLIVKQHDAHAWIEVLLPHYGWTFFEATPRGNLLSNENKQKLSISWFENLELMFNLKVIPFNFEGQLLLLSQVKTSLDKKYQRIKQYFRTVIDYKKLTLFFTLCIITAFSLVCLRLPKKKKNGLLIHPHLKKIKNQYLHLLSKKGIKINPHLPLKKQIDSFSKWPSKNMHLKFINLYNKMRFGLHNQTKSNFDELNKIFKALKSHVS